MRRISLFLHRWLGLTAGLIFGIAALTGAVLVYERELNSMLTPTADSTPGLATPSEIEASFRKQHPGHRIVSIKWPTPGARVFVLRATDGLDPYSVELDSRSAREFQSRRTHILVTAIRRLHGSLFLGRIGSVVVTYSTIASIVSLLLGVYLWWPGLRNLARGFRIRFRKGLYPVTYDLHQTSGIIALPILLLLSLTGVLRESAVLRGYANSAWSSPRSEVSSETVPSDIDLAAVVRAAQNETGGRPVTRVTYPSQPNGVFDVWLEGISGWPGGAATRVGVDRHTGAVLARRDLAYDAEVNDRLHFALVGGPVVRVLYALSSFVGAGLFLTGVVMWWKRPTPVGRR